MLANDLTKLQLKQISTITRINAQKAPVKC